MRSKFTKIVATIGPSSRNYECIREIIDNGANVIRLNFSHGTFEDHKQSVDMVRKAAKDLGNSVAIFQDLQGPKIRVGKLDGEYIEIEDDEELIITTDDIVGGVIDGKKKISIDYSNLHKEASVGNRILLDDGLMELRVEKIDGKNIHTRVINGGKLKPRKGVNFPHVKLNISAITEKDRKDLSFAFENDIDYVALSFVRDAKDVRELIEIMLKDYGKRIPIISKIEKPEAFDDIDDIIEVSDAIMVARGDLGVETSPQEVPIMQKSIIRKCNIAGKPVITATQMLESMITNPRPTRAEANDVANAILDGTDAVMLSGETASGKYPVEAVSMMADIARQVEKSQIFERVLSSRPLTNDELEESAKEDVSSAISFATVELAYKVHAKYIVSFTHSGGTAKAISKYRTPIPIVAISPVKSTVRLLSLVWGVWAYEMGTVSTVNELLEGAVEMLKVKEHVEKKDMLVITAGVPVGIAGSTNMIKVYEV